MNRVLRKSLKWLLWIVVFLVFLVVLQVTVLAFPSPWFENSVKQGNLTIYSDGIGTGEMESIASDVHRRVEAAEIYNDDVELRVFICNRQGLYNFFARLSLVPVRVPGFNLSIFNNSFISATTLAKRRAGVYGHVKYSAIAGKIEQCIAHELIHDYTQEKIGVLAYRRIPAWKTEGYAEYAASKAFTDGGGAESLTDRITFMQNEIYDAGVRDYYRWRLIVEFLSDKRGYSFDDIMDPGVTLASADSEMMSWYQKRN